MTRREGSGFSRTPPRVAEILPEETIVDPGAGDDHGPLPVCACDDRVPAEPEPAGNQ